MKDANKSIKPALWALAGMALIWGYNWVIVKEALRFAGAFDFSALRSVFGSLCLFLLLLYRGQGLRPRDVPMTLLLGLLTTTGSVGFSTWALESGAAGKTAVLVYTMPFWVLLLAWPILAERIRGLQWLAVLMAFSGLAVILEPWRHAGTPMSKILAILGGLTWAGSAITLKIMRRRGTIDLVSLTAWQMFFGAVPLAIIAFAVHSPPIQWTPYFTAALAYNIVFTSAIAHLLWFLALRELPAGMAGMGTLATPVIGVISASVELGERPSSSEIWGIVLVLSALALLTWIGIRNHRNNSVSL
ncbi:MAG TPA: EamA family transporter [Syntrophales bacterium]|nr:EamA family transporter [Syntrophales bacterium]HRT63063.1 EamA family transporter [Syntrophales bacterium]